MSTVAFRLAFTVTAEEDGSNTALGDLSFEPTAETRQRLANHRLIVRARVGGFQLYAQYNLSAGGARLGEITAPVSFIFGIRQADPTFLKKRYHPDLTALTGPALYLTNRIGAAASRASGQLSVGATVEATDATRIVARQVVARADLTATPTPTHLTVADRWNAARVLRMPPPPAAQTLPNAPITAPAQSESAAVSVDLSADPGFAYTIAPKPPGTAKTTLFVDDELAGRGAFGVLELVAEPRSGPEPAGGRVYFARFRKRN